MRLLFLAPNPPSPRTGGGSLRMFHMVRFLGARFDVEVVGPALEGAKEAEELLSRSCHKLEFVPPSPGGPVRRMVRLGPYERDPALADAVNHRLASKAYAAVQVEKPAMLPYLPSHTQIPIILDTWAFGLAGPLRALRHERGIVTRARNLIRLLRFSLFDAFCWPPTAWVLVVSEIDRLRCLRRRPGSRVLVIPNGVDCGAIRPGPARTDGPPTLLFTGDLGFAPNVEAALLLAQSIFPRVRAACPSAELHLVGRNPDPRLVRLQGAGVRVTGAVEDMRPFLQAATAYVAPHFTGAGTRTKLLEAMAAGLPILTTSVGIEGIEAAHDREVLIADDPAEMVMAIGRLLSDPSTRTRLGAAARRLAEERYDWMRCLAPLETLYAELLSPKATPC